MSAANGGRPSLLAGSELRSRAGSHFSHLLCELDQRRRARDPRDITYGGYQIIGLEHGGGVVGGWGNANLGYAFDLGDVEVWVKEWTNEEVEALRRECRKRPRPVAQGAGRDRHARSASAMVARRAALALAWLFET